MAEPRHRLMAVRLDDQTIARGTPDQEHERAIAIYDLVERNEFAPAGHPGGPYALTLALIDGKLVFDVTTEDGAPVCREPLSLQPLRRILRDYFQVCEHYYAAIRTQTPSQIEAIDMGRRGLHNEAAQLLQDRLEGTIAIDFQTARQFFTLLTALHWKG
ncbi:MAG: UPF0262 family protein [Beijerinckiaceae bacterium]